MERSFKQKIMLIGIPILVVISIIGIAYSVFTGQLNISGTAVGRQSNWDVHFENVSNITTTGTAKVLSNHQPVINNNNPTQIQDYEVSLTSPSDSISFTFDVVNDGNYNAKITSVNVGTPECTSTDTTSATNMCNNLTYTLTYSSGASIQTNDIVYAKDKVSMKVTLTFNNINDASLLPDSGVSISNLGIQINFEQQGNALVNETTGEVANNKVYHQGEKITLNNEDYYIIAYSGIGQDYVVALKDVSLTAAEVNLYGGSGTENNHINRYTSSSTGITSNGNIVVYSSETCGYINGSWVTTNCINNYDDSDIKYVVDAWAADKFQNNELKIVNSYKSRLITEEEYLAIPNTNSWRYSSYEYWTMTFRYGFTVRVNANGNTGLWSNYYVAHCKVRPVINIYKSVLENNND